MNTMLAPAATMVRTMKASRTLIPYLAGLPLTTIDGHDSAVGVFKLCSEIKSYKRNGINIFCK